MDSKILESLRKLPVDRKAITPEREYYWDLTRASPLALKARREQLNEKTEAGISNDDGRPIIEELQVIDLLLANED